MPVKKRECELDDGTKVWVRQASGMERLAISNAQARVFRSFDSWGDPAEWDEAQQIEFAEALDRAGCGIEAQLTEWLVSCVLDEGFDQNLFTLEELMPILAFVRGDETEGAVGFLTSSE